MTYHKDAYVILRRCATGAVEDADDFSAKDKYAEWFFEARISAAISTLRALDHIPATRKVRDGLTAMARDMAPHKAGCLDWAQATLKEYGE